MADIRTFIAVDLPQQIKMDIDKMIAGLRHESPGIRWVKAANLHLTLRFLGDIPEQSVAGLAESLKENLGGFGPFELALAGMGGFPNLRKPRVIWIGTGDGTDRLIELAAKVENGCEESGFGKGDKKFSSHLTVGRIKFPDGLESVLNKVEKSTFESPKFTVSQIIVVESDLSPAGPKYTKLESVSL